MNCTKTLELCMKNLTGGLAPVRLKELLSPFSLAQRKRLLQRSSYGAKETAARLSARPSRSDGNDVVGQAVRKFNGFSTSFGNKLNSPPIVGSDSNLF